MSEASKNVLAAGDDELIVAGDDELIFADEDEAEDEPIAGSWKILIVDDEIEIHNITKLALNEFIFENKLIAFISAYSGKEAKEIIESNPDIALILLDVVMETEEAGLEVVKYIRDILDNQVVRIILRTGQPGQVPEDVVIVSYDINDYKTKTELTNKKLFTTVVTALRAFRALTQIEASKSELEKIAAASARFVPREFLKFLQRESIVDARLGDSVQAEMTIMFADIRSFTSLSESMSPRENFEFLNSYLSRVGPVIRQYSGFIDKYIGDGIMALFPNCAEDAVQAAIEMQQQVKIYNKHRQNCGYKPISIGIGLHTGTLMLGTIGEAERMESTVISDAVNLASRVEGLTKLYGVGIVASVQTLCRIDDPQHYKCRFLDRVQVKGKQAPVAVFEIYDGDSDIMIELKGKTQTDFEQGIFFHYQQQFAQARQMFLRVLQVNKYDKAALFYAERCDMLMKNALIMTLEGIEI
ncbi:MAG: response regulator [Microcoleus sp. PH2017_10_PVI_O_A]|uniref:adenylate/guanylate cyclase domain-containing protein n=1 Tax=unclassified Microcoleus TaxID=2642155 RepID=UPI001DDD679A|nr:MULTISPECIES: adenylate/guanylate cyclase domain-containing protein [unclassified Microcoleus]TAE80750.1 MAG: response regulator [Oscillatoriales cyanobacterium]MCC3407426.1 response regulator [Microcoleus sp. PH2017_10_PVI_O_A]MCC3461506.1 response regulator [Microcoleus sp. PH2017_11_PCY_U_A]MCC3479980.1 response regulator [Microcoleus sp. PH2017_12_PCY_D_A]MCC3529786.1 response regulator [Microcoleus sp. PH2017_21_RUC_O_A]